MKFPYLVYKLHREDTVNEFYGIFRDIIPHMQAINNAQIALHRAINTRKVFVTPDAVTDKQKFDQQYGSPGVSRVDVDELEGIKEAVKPGSAEEQLTIINYHLQQIKEDMGINDAFLGVSAASDSGRKVEIQRQSTVNALKPIERTVQQIFRLLGGDMCNFYTQYWYHIKL